LGVPNKPFAAQNSVCIITVVSFKDVFEAGGYFFLHPERTAYHETLSDQHLVQLRLHPIHRGGVICPPAKSGIWLILDAASKKAKRKAPYFKRSTVPFWWRIAGSNR
jgi:hypothetical protein